MSAALLCGVRSYSAVAQAIIDGGGDYVMVVKTNQPQLHADIDQVFAMPAAEQEISGTARTPRSP